LPPAIIALYLAWLAAYGTWERDDVFDSDADDDLEPPMPAGLGTLTAPRRELADFLRLDDDLLAVAAAASLALGETADDPDGSRPGSPACPPHRRRTARRSSAPAGRATGRTKHHGALTSGIRTARRPSGRGGLAAATSCPGFDLRAE